MTSHDAEQPAAAKIYDAPRYLPAGDAALVVEFGDAVDADLNQRALAADAVLREARRLGALKGVIETTPSFRSVLIEFDPLETDAAEVEARVRSLLDQGGRETPSVAGARLWRLPVCYEREVGLDLEDVAARIEWSVEEVIAWHLHTEWTAFMIGFLPGCPFLGRLPSRLSLPRRAEPRLAVPAGSVAIAVGLCVIYPVESPGGWNVLGRTPAPLFDPEQTRPSLIAPGDHVRFERIGLADLARLTKAADEGIWRPKSRLLQEGSR